MPCKAFVFKNEEPGFIMPGLSFHTKFYKYYLIRNATGSMY